jgi:hypothetical protein
MFTPQWARPFRFQKAGLGLIPLLECADGNLLLEQRSSSSRGEATSAHFALGTRASDPLTNQSDLPNYSVNLRRL